MSSEEDTAQLNKHYSNKVDDPEENTIDLTEAVFNNGAESTEPADSVSRSLPKHCVTEGISHKKKKRKSGAAELFRGMKRQTSGKMRDKPTEFEEVTKLEATKADPGAAYLSKVPKPADWLKTPNERTIWSRVYDEKSGPKTTAATEQMAKITKLTECMKHMNIEIHPDLHRSWYLEGLEAAASALGLRVVTTPELSPGAVAITRTVPRELVTDQTQSLTLSTLRRNSLRFLYIICASETSAHITRQQLTEHIATKKLILGGQLTLLVLDTEKYFKKGKPQMELEAAIVDLLVALEVDTLVMRSPDELVSTILQFTKAVAEEPAKLAKRAVDEQAEFYMRGDNKKCVTVDQQGNGLPRAWQQMLSVLPHSSLEVGRAVHSQYNTPRLMAEGVSTEEGVVCLGNLGITRSAVPGARARRLGNEMAKRMKILFTTLDGELIVE